MLIVLVFCKCQLAWDRLSEKNKAKLWQKYHDFNYKTCPGKWEQDFPTSVGWSHHEFWLLLGACGKVSPNMRNCVFFNRPDSKWQWHPRKWTRCHQSGATSVPLPHALGKGTPTRSGPRVRTWQDIPQKAHIEACENPCQKSISKLTCYPFVSLGRVCAVGLLCRTYQLAVFCWSPLKQAWSGRKHGPL